MSLLKKYFARLAELSAINSIDVDLNRKQVVNITYLFSMIVGLLSAIVFMVNDWVIESTVHFLGAAVSLMGFVLSIKGYSRTSRLLFPVACATYIVFCTFLFYGSDSHFMWLLVVLAAYSVTGFRVEGGKAQLLVCFFALVAFAFIKLFAPTTTQYVSMDARLLIALCTFTASCTLIVLIAGVVVTKLRRLNEHLRNLAEVDDLTKLSNRRKVLAEAVNVFADSIINNQRCCFAILDLDHFKNINDRFGHEAGDTVLKSFARVMANNARRGDWVGRYGGEEFVIVMPNTRIKDAVSVMEHLRIQIADLAIQIEGHVAPIHVTTSIGVAEITDDTARYEQILARADEALYMAKNNGRNRVEINVS
ncbi:GGDEF domain-containing protein [Marinomonas gallaica]|uniref:GGDEF domain-containing protein n=1 Tax=Marinomonas gallaica TaxID=1806667 RepID=UPI003CE56AF1